MKARPKWNLWGLVVWMGQLPLHVHSENNVMAFVATIFIAANTYELSKLLPSPDNTEINHKQP